MNIYLYDGIDGAAAYYVAFGPHGPRTPVNPPGVGLKVAASVLGLAALTGVIVTTIKSFGASSSLLVLLRTLSNIRVIPQH